MENLKNELIKENKEDLNRQLKQIKTEEGFKLLMSHYGRVYKNNPKTKLIKYLNKQAERRLKEHLTELEQIEKSKDFNGELIITVEWKKSYMWGSNPRAYTNYGFVSESVGGCGYDKLSTATAYALNSYLPLLKLLFKKKDKLMKNFKGEDKKNAFNRSVLGYGSGYNILPHFEGGVGDSSHINIVEGLGLKMQHVTNTDNTDVYLIKKV